MGLRRWVDQRIEEKGTQVGDMLATHRTTQMQNEQATLGQVIKVEEGFVYVQYADGSVVRGVAGTRTLVEGDKASVIGGRVF